MNFCHTHMGPLCSLPGLSYCGWCQGFLHNTIKNISLSMNMLWWDRKCILLLFWNGRPPVIYTPAVLHIYLFVLGVCVCVHTDWKIQDDTAVHWHISPCGIYSNGSTTHPGAITCPWLSFSSHVSVSECVCGKVPARYRVSVSMSTMRRHVVV